MNHLYRFSPITDEETFHKALEYLTIQLEELSQKILSEKLPISILKIFPHYPEEYSYLYNLIHAMGPEASFSSKESLYVNVHMYMRGHTITNLGVRFVDPYRMQVGCGDYEVENFETYRQEHLLAPFVRDTKDSTDMLEIWHPDFDVLGYVIQKE